LSPLLALTTDARPDEARPTTARAQATDANKAFFMGRRVLCSTRRAIFARQGITKR
jgi:hypothetical protein